MVHPSVVVLVEVVKQIRQAIIKMSNYTKKNKEQKESKESELYNFITNDNFVGRIEEIHFVQDRLLSLQEKEEKNHQTMWKERTKNIE